MAHTPSKNKYRYGPGAVIQADDSLKTLALSMVPRVIGGTISKTAVNFVAVDVPLYTSQNIFPLKTNNNLKTAFVMQAYILNAATLTDANWKAELKFPGRPVSHPQRKNRGKRKITTQVFTFPGDARFASLVCIVVRTLHHFFEEDSGANKVTFDLRRAIAAKFENVTVTA